MKPKGMLNIFKSINSSKYDKVKRVKPEPDITKQYDIRPDGWRRKR